MTRQRQIILIPVLAWVLVALSAGCALTPPREVPPQTGRVLDVETQQPIEGAIVVLRWQGVGTKAFVDTQTVCYHVESAVTDTEGRYVTDVWREASMYRDLSMKQVLQTAYKSGYRHVRTDIATGDQYLRRDMRNAEDRLEYLMSMANDSCFSEEFKEFIPLNDAIYREAKEIAVTDEQQQVAGRILFYLNVLIYGWDEAFRMKH